MLSQEFLSPVNVAEAKIQKRIGKFLSLRETLQKLSLSKLLPVREKAQSLLSKQAALKKQLDYVLDRVEEIKKGSWTATDIVQIPAFAAMMEKQIRDVRKLQEEAGDSVPKSKIPWKWILGGLGAYWLLRKVL